MTIDWEEQWRHFSPNFYDGISHIDLSLYAPACHRELLLKPGGGFGDLSHPTTRLCLKLMAPYVDSSTVIDIGCGSGILTLAALLLGAKRGIGIDIEEEALIHARENARLNKLRRCTHFTPQLNRTPPKPPLLILMNMISSEQKIAWNAHPQLHHPNATLITSGILKREKKEYLKWAKEQGWELIDQSTEKGWMGFVFQQSALMKHSFR
jgi:ribosomal protein L11 methyltransferase